MDLMEAQVISRRAIKINGAALSILLLAFTSLAQKTSQQSKAWNPCEDPFSNEGERVTSQSAKVKVEFIPVSSRRVKSSCDSLSFVLADLQINQQTRDRIHDRELFSFDSRAAKLSAGRATRTNAQAQGPQDNVADTQELAKKLANPVASLISFPLQSNFDFGMGAGSGWRYALNVQPVIPVRLGSNWNMITRTIIPIIHQGNVTGPNTSQTGLGDTVQSLFFSPDKSEPFIWAVGPVFLFPTATDAALGGQKWGVGPTALVIKQKNGWTYGVLANHLWSVAGKSNRDEVNATFVQPVLSYTTKDAWTYSINTESTYDWVSKRWSTPINPFISKLVRFGKQPLSFGGGMKCWVTTPSGGPEGCGLRFSVTALFPKK